MQEILKSRHCSQYFRKVPSVNVVFFVARGPRSWRIVLLNLASCFDQYEALDRVEHNSHGAEYSKEPETRNYVNHSNISRGIALRNERIAKRNEYNFACAC